MDLLVFSLVVVLCVAILIAILFYFRRWHRNGYRFSLRGLLLTFGIVACGLFVAIRFIVPNINHRWAVYNIDRYAQVVFSGDFDTGGVQTSNESFSRWRDVEIVHVTSDYAALQIAKQLASLPEVGQISFGGAVTNAGLAAICQLRQHPTLESLQFIESPITDAGIAKLANLPNLHQVVINTCPIGDSALDHLKSIPKLQMLTLTEEGPKANPRRFTAVGFAAIGELKQLTSLQLIRIQISDASALHLTALKHLKTLHFSQCQISDEALATIHQALPDREITVFEPQKSALTTPTGK